MMQINTKRKVDLNNIISVMGVIDLLSFLKSKLFQIQNIDEPVKLQEIPGKLLKITIPECLPHMSIYRVKLSLSITNRFMLHIQRQGKDGLTRKALNINITPEHKQYLTTKQIT